MNSLPRRTLLLGLLVAWACIGTAAPQPNILVVLVDDAGYNDFGFMGCPDLPTPHIDRLAGMGTVLTDAHVTATVCSPSRAGLLTGRYQQRFGHECNVPPHDQGMDPAEKTIGDVLRTAGYRTICIGKWHVGNRTMFHPNNRGFDEFWGFLEGGRSYFPDPKVDRVGNYRAIQHNRRQVDFEGYLTDRFTDRAMAYIDETVDRPWFIYLSYNAVHTPMHAKEEDLERFAGHPRQKLAAMTWSLDENIGRLVDHLESRGLLEKTLVFFLSDNGGAGLHNNQSRNDPLKGWKGNKFEGGHRVPFFVTWKGVVPGGARHDGLSSALDILPTAASAAGIADWTGKPWDGVDLVPHLSGEMDTPPHERLFWRKDAMAGMREGDWKLIRLEGFGHRLYNLAEDLGESDDLGHRFPHRLATMQAALIAWDNEQALPRWYEDEDWSNVTYEIHRALMENASPAYRTPDQMRAYEDRESRGSN